MRRDPLAELYAERARGRSSSTLLAPVTHPFTGRVYWLSIGQFLTYAWLRRRMRHERGETTLERIAADLATSPGRISRRLDRLAAWGLIGRHSTRGRFGRTRFWPPRARRAALPRPAPGANVSPSTPFGGFLTREGLTAAWQRRRARRLPPRPPGGGPSRAGARPPHLLYERCPLEGGSVRLERWQATLLAARHEAGPRRLRGHWGGACRRCGALLVGIVDVAIPREQSQPVAVGVVLAERFRHVAGGRDPAVDVRPVVEPSSARRHELALELLASGEIEDAYVRDAIRARHAPELPSGLEPDPPVAPAPLLVASESADRGALLGLVERWSSGELELASALDPAGYGPGRRWWDATRARLAASVGQR